MSQCQRLQERAVNVAQPAFSTGFLKGAAVLLSTCTQASKTAASLFIRKLIDVSLLFGLPSANSYSTVLRRTCRHSRSRHARVNRHTIL